MKNILKIAAAAGIMLGGSVAMAQSGNGSDVSGVSGSSVAGGAFTPLPTGRGAAGSGVGGIGSSGATISAGITATAANFSSGATVTSSITGTAIAPAAVAAVGALISGGSPASVATVGAGLTGAGASPATVARLTSALAALANHGAGNSRAEVRAAAQAYNALIKDAPASFFTSNNGGPPASILAIQAALSSMITATH